MILITGATGYIGSVVLDYAVAKNLEVRAAARDPSKASAQSKTKGVEWVRFDFDDPSTFKPALELVDQVFLYHGENIDLFLEAAKAAGVKLIVYLSTVMVNFFGDPSDNEPSWIRDSHTKSENLVKASGIPYVLLRPAEFTKNILGIAGMIKQGEVHFPFVKGKTNHVHENDIAEVAIAAFINPELVGPEPWLTSDELLSYEEIVEIIGKVIGKKIKVTELSEEVAVANMKQAGYPDHFVAAAIQYRRHAQNGFILHTTSEIERILGKPPIKFEEYVKEHIADFQ